MKPSRPLNVIELILLMGGLFCTAYGISRTIHETNIIMLVVIAALGLIWGILSGGSKLSFKQALGCTILIGLFALGLILQRVFPPLLRLLASIAFWHEQLNASVLTRLPEAAPVISSCVSVWENIFPLYVRFAIWVRQLLLGVPTIDPLVIRMIWMFLLWLISSWAGWAARRIGSSFLWLIPALILVAGITGYTQANSISIFLLLAIILPLSILTAQINRERQWNATNFDYSLEVRLDLAVSGIFLIAILLGAAALTPSITYQDLTRLWEKITEPPASSQSSENARSLGLQAPTRSAHLATYQSPGLPQEHLIGSGPDLSQKVVMTITADDAPFAPWLAETRSIPRHYWRAFTYNFYTGRGWASSPIYAADFEPHSPLAPLPAGNISLFQYQINIIGNANGLFYYTGNPQSTDTPVSLYYRTEKDLFGGTTSGQKYSTETAIPISTEAQLVNIHTRIPAWISARYRQLPENLPNRVIQLAQRITSSEISPYDQARAIESYLRKIPYTLNLPEPPINHDVVDYFLFTQKEGYCDYYATSMVVLARAAGLPARLVTGYASGTYDFRNGRWIITEADAHSWAEVYLADVGWVEFEPTASRRRLNPVSVPGVETGLMLPSSKPFTESNPFIRLIDWGQVGKFLPYGVGSLWITVWLWLYLQKFWFQRLPANQAAAWLYRNLQISAARLGVRPNISQTPVEWMFRFRKRLQLITRANLPRSLSHDLDIVQNFYLESIYSPHTQDSTKQHIAWNAGKRLSRKIQWVLIQWNLKNLHRTYNGTRRRFNDQEMDRYDR